MGGLKPSIVRRYSTLNEEKNMDGSGGWASGRKKRTVLDRKKREKHQLIEAANRI